MKVYRVIMSYFDGDHDHGRYESPIFLKREDAERFRQALIDLPENDERKWWTDPGYGPIKGPEEAYIEEIEVLESWDGEIKAIEAYLTVTWT